MKLIGYVISKNMINETIIFYPWGSLCEVYEIETVNNTNFKYIIKNLKVNILYEENILSQTGLDFFSYPIKLTKLLKLVIE